MSDSRDKERAVNVVRVRNRRHRRVFCEGYAGASGKWMDAYIGQGTADNIAPESKVAVFDKSVSGDLPRREHQLGQANKKSNRQYDTRVCI